MPAVNRRVVGSNPTPGASSETVSCPPEPSEPLPDKGLRREEGSGVFGPSPSQTIAKHQATSAPLASGWQGDGKETSADLARIVEAWGDLPLHIRVSILPGSERPRGGSRSPRCRLPDPGQWRVSTWTRPRPDCSSEPLPPAN